MWLCVHAIHTQHNCVRPLCFEIIHTQAFSVNLRHTCTPIDMLLTSTSAHLSTAKMHSKFTTLTFLQGQAIYQILHILVSITQPIVESGYFSRFIWPSRGGRVFLLNTPSPKHNWALLSGQTLSSPAATDGTREIVRSLETELRVSSDNCLSQFLFSFLAFSSGKLSLSSCMFLPSARLICLKLYNDEQSCIMLLHSLSLCWSLLLPLSIRFSPTSPLSDFLNLSVPFSASHPLPPSLSVVEW